MLLVSSKGNRDVIKTKKPTKTMGTSKESDVTLTEEELAKKAVDNADSQEEQKVYKKRQFQHKFKLGRHYTMERFTIMFGSLLLG